MSPALCLRIEPVESYTGCRPRRACQFLGGVERVFNVARWTEMPVGGHFAALEQPRALAIDIHEVVLSVSLSEKATNWPWKFAQVSDMIARP